MNIKPGIGLPIKNPEDRRYLTKTQEALEHLNHFDYEEENTNYVAHHSSNASEKIQQMRRAHEREFEKKMGIKRDLKHTLEENQNFTQTQNQYQGSFNYQPNNNNSLIFQPTPQYTNQTFDPNRSSFEDVKKHRRFNPVPALFTLLILSFVGAGAWYTGYVGKIKQAFASQALPVSQENQKSRESTFQTENAKNYEECVKDGGFVENIQKVDGCTLDGKLYVKEIALENWNELVKIKKDSLKNNIIPFSPINITELTTFRVGKDLNKDLIIGNTVYSANVNNNSEAYGLMYITSPNFGTKPEGRDAVFNTLNEFLKGGNFDTNFNKLIATDPDTLNKNQIFLMDLPEFNKELIDTHFNPENYRTILVKEKVGENDTLSMQVWINAVNSTILLEENFSNSQNQKVIDVLNNACQKLDDVNCNTNTIEANEEIKKYLNDLSAGLINKFQIK